MNLNSTQKSVMPKNKKPAGGRPAKNYVPKGAGSASRPSFGGTARGAAGSKPGARSAGHRGFREEVAGRKDRWSPEERAARGARPVRDDRGSFAPRDDRSAERPRFDRDARPARDDRGYGTRDDRPRYDRDARPARDDRGFAPRGERPRFDRDARPARDDRGFAPREDRGDRPRFDRNARPARDDRGYGARDDRPRYDRDARPAREDRPRFDRSAERPARDDRGFAPREDRGDRPRFDRGGDRPARSGGFGSRDRFDREDRPRFGGPDRGGRGGFDRSAERPARRDSDFYPSKTEGERFVPADDVVLERLEAQAITADDTAGVSFSELGLGDNICRQLATMGAASPFPIQAATIPVALTGKDVLGRGKTGSGKTIAFGAPLVERLMENNGGRGRKQGRGARALILAPTRELAMQIDRTVQPIARSVGLFTATIVGGMPQQSQVMSLRRGVDILIATPGRLEDLANQGHIDLADIQITVLDEADHMCDLGFLEPVQRILRATDPEGQRMLFSATLDKGVAAIVDEFLTEPSVHEVTGEDQASSTIDHRVFVVDQRDKINIIQELVDRDGKTLIFTRTRAFAEQLADEIDDAGIRATSLHGDLNQSRRTRNLQLLTSGRVNVLVATDVAARGIHVDDIDLVVQADAPDEYKTYMHRSGRTGRAGKEGKVVTLITKARQRRMSDLLKRAEINVDMAMVRPGDRVIAEVSGMDSER